MSVSKILLPREAAKYIAENAKEISLDRRKLTDVADRLYEIYKSGAYSLQSWKNHELNPKAMDNRSANWVFVCDTLNFSFWSEQPNRGVVRYGGKGYTGYWSLCAAMNRAIDEEIDILNPSFYSRVTLKELSEILRTDEGPPIPMMEERVKNLQEAGRVLVEVKHPEGLEDMRRFTCEFSLQKYDGDFANVLKVADKSAMKLLDIVVSDFESYRDEAEFEGRKVALYKRAQILIADIWGCFEGKGLGEFHDINQLTAFADYRVPQVLAYLGVINYSDALMKRLREGRLFISGERLEVEIRGWSLHAIELLKEELQKKSLKNEDGDVILVNSILIDFYLWDYRRDFADDVDVMPMHKIRCIYY